MEHLVKGHMGGYWIDNRDIDEIMAYDEDACDFDEVLLSWEEGEMLEALKKYFSIIKKSRNSIENYYKKNTPKPVLIESMVYKYDEGNNILCYLFEDNKISLDEYNELKQIIKDTRKKQISLILEVYSNDKKETCFGASYYDFKKRCKGTGNFTYNDKTVFKDTEESKTLINRYKGI